MRRLIVPMLLMLVVGFAARPAAAELPDAVKRYVDDATLLVGRIDATRFDSEAILAFLEEAAADQPEDQRQEMMAEARQGVEQATQQLKPLVDAGVKDAYFIVDGRVSLAICDASGCRQISVLGGGELFGWSPIVGRSRLFDTARAETAVQALAFDADELMNYCKHHPEFGFEFMRRAAAVLAERLVATRQQLVEMSGVHLPEFTLETD